MEQEQTPQELNQSKTSEIVAVDNSSSQDNEQEPENTPFEVSESANLEVTQEDNSNLHATQEQYTELEKKYQELKQKHEKLELEYQKQNQELLTVKAKLQKLEAMNKSKFEHLIKDSLRRDADSWQEDDSEYQKYGKLGKYWQDKNKLLFSELSAIISECINEIEKNSQLISQFSDLYPLAKHLANRQESLQLIQKMLERLSEPLERLKNPHFSPTELIKVQESELLNLAQIPADEKKVKIIIDKKNREVENSRNQSIRECRDCSENLQKQWLHFIEKRFLPILDAIDSGKKYSEDLKVELPKNYPSYDEEISQYLQIYSRLQETLLTTIQKVGIQPMNVEIGKPVNYLLHDPIGTEEDFNLDNESIKEVTRKGYEYTHDLLDKTIPLRSPQVVVVKNN